MSALQLDPLEKKPLYHVLPGRLVLSAGFWGCSLRCPWCQNASLLQPQTGRGLESSPARLIAEARRLGAPALAFTYNEPTVALELLLEAAPAARAAGLVTVLVTSAFVSLETAATLARVFDAVNIDLKDWDTDRHRRLTGGALADVQAAARVFEAQGVWVEYTTLLRPDMDPDEPGAAELAAWIAAGSPDRPWHLSAFHPAHRWADRPATRLEDLQRLAARARLAGLRSVYLGNVSPEAGGRDTVCPGCGQIVLKRDGPSGRPAPGFTGVCPGCGTPLPGLWEARHA